MGRVVLVLAPSCASDGRAGVREGDNSRPPGGAGGSQVVALEALLVYSLAIATCRRS